MYTYNMTQKVQIKVSQEYKTRQSLSQVHDLLGIEGEGDGARESPK